MEAVSSADMEGVPLWVINMAPGEGFPNKEKMPNASCAEPPKYLHFIFLTFKQILINFKFI